MLEIIPNWHPIFVHFTVALLSLSVVLFVLAPLVKPPLRRQWQIVARWSLWFGAGITVITALTGLYAYNTVAHDTPSHAAMTDHRNWALATLGLFLGLALWSILRVRRGQGHGAPFLVALLIAGGVLASAAWHGGEVVFRYGLGVMSLPQTHAHEHTGEETAAAAQGGPSSLSVSVESAPGGGHGADEGHALSEGAHSEVTSGGERRPPAGHTDDHDHPERH